MITARSELAKQAAGAAIGAGYGPTDFDVPPATATLIAEAVPENTALAYRSRWRSFEAWCTHAGRVPLPATAQTVAAYLTHLATARGLKATTVDAHLTAIRAVHRGAGATTPDALTARKVVVAAQRREAARDGRYGPRRAVPVMAADLPPIVAACDDQTAAGLRDRAVVLLGFALLARRSELAALNLSDVELVPGEGIAVTIRASKTDQSARGVIRRIHYAANERVCPVRAVLAWTSFLAGRDITAGPLFTRIDRWGNVGPTAGGRYADRLPSDAATAPSVSGGSSRDGRLRPQAVGAIVTALCESAGPPNGPKPAGTAATASAAAGPPPCSRPEHSRCTSAATADGPTVPVRSPATSRRPPASATPTRQRACCYASRPEPVVPVSRQDNATASGQATSAVPMTRSARPVVPPLVVSSMRYQASKAKSVATAAADTADRRPHGTEGPRRQAPAGQAIMAMKATPAHSPCIGEPPTCSGFAATSTLAAPAAARISRPGIAAGRSVSAVIISHAPVTANAAVITHGSAASRSVRVLMVLATQLKEGGRRAVATVNPPTRNTRAAEAESTPHQGTRCPAVTAGENRAASLPGACLPAVFTFPIPSRLPPVRIGPPTTCPPTMRGRSVGAALANPSRVVAASDLLGNEAVEGPVIGLIVAVANDRAVDVSRYNQDQRAG